MYHKSYKKASTCTSPGHFVSIMIHKIRAADTGEIGSRIREERRKLGWNQTELAEKCRVSRVTVSRLERGDYGDIGLAKVSRICTALHLTLGIGPMRIDEEENQAEENAWAVEAAERADEQVRRTRGIRV